MSEDPIPYQAGIAAQAAQQAAKAPAVRAMLRAQIAGQILAATVFHPEMITLINQGILPHDFAVAETDKLLATLEEDPKVVRARLGSAFK
jgi:hypothetical protein